MDGREKSALIRQGNEAFNNGDIPEACRIFKETDYKDGLIRVGDYYYYQKRQPLMAYGYYRQANHTIMIDRLSESFIFALKHWLKDDDTNPEIKPADTPETTDQENH